MSALFIRRGSKVALATTASIILGYEMSRFHRNETDQNLSICNVNSNNFTEALKKWKWSDRLISYCDSSASSVADTSGFPAHHTSLKLCPNTKLTLSGVGMRRKNFYIVEVDVYRVGLYFSSEAQKLAKNAFTSSGSVSEAIFEGHITRHSNGISPPMVSTNLRFVRQVTTAQVVEAFNDAFVGCNADSVGKFKSILRESIGENGMKVGEEIMFFWLKDGGLAFEKGGKLSDVINDTEVEKRLLEVYVDPKRSVSPELVKSFHKYIQESI